VQNPGQISGLTSLHFETPALSGSQGVDRAGQDPAAAVRAIIASRGDARAGGGAADVIEQPRKLDRDIRGVRVASQVAIGDHSVAYVAGVDTAPCDIDHEVVRAGRRTVVCGRSPCVVVTVALASKQITLGSIYSCYPGRYAKILPEGNQRHHLSGPLSLGKDGMVVGHGSRRRFVRCSKQDAVDVPVTRNLQELAVSNENERREKILAPLAMRSGRRRYCKVAAAQSYKVEHIVI